VSGLSGLKAYRKTFLVLFTLAFFQVTRHVVQLPLYE